MRIAVVGAGLSGATVAHVLAQRGHKIDLYEGRDHVAGNCHTSRDIDTGVMVHDYGPHIFHTNNMRVWDFVQRFDTFKPFSLRPKAVADGKVFSFPINLLTMEQLYGALTPDRMRERLDFPLIHDPDTFEGVARMSIGDELYELFFEGYTRKQWGRDPALLPAAVFNRIPIRFNYDDRAHDHLYQGMPTHGYTRVVENMLDSVHGRIKVHLSCGFSQADAKDYDHVFYSGPLDLWFGREHGRLPYRTLDFVYERSAGDFQGTAVINYCDEWLPFTRIVEHKHFAPWERHDRTIIHREYSRDCGECDEPFYPVPMAKDSAMLTKYMDCAAREKNVTFIGRLGTYRYLDMDRAIAEALKVTDTWSAS